MDKSSSNDTFPPPGGFQYQQNSNSGQAATTTVNKFIAIPLDKVRLLKPWGDFFNPQALSQPSAQVQSRLGSNLRFFEANYYSVLIAVFVFFLLINIPLLLVTLLIAGMFMSINACSGNGKDVVVGQMSFPLNYALGVWLVLSIVLLGMVNAFGTFFWVLGLSACLIGLHALFYDDSRTSAVSATLVDMEAGDS